MTKEKARIFKLLERACTQTPDEGLLAVIGSCFAAGDISHIGDAELIDNLHALIRVNSESKTLKRNRNK